MSLCLEIFKFFSEGFTLVGTVMDESIDISAILPENVHFFKDIVKNVLILISVH